MLFNSLEFFVFFPLVYAAYLFLSHNWQNRMLLAASYVFYGAWDPRFLSLILISTVVDYFCGIKISESESTRRRKAFLWLSIAVNLGILGFFKYYNFFALNLQSLFSVFGWPADLRFLKIVLPVGISFYTFQTMSYTIDIYRRQMEPTRNFRDFALFVAYFPQLVAGPIERAQRLLPQIVRPRTLTYQRLGEGCYLITWGFFLKAFIADNLAPVADSVFGGEGPYHTVAVLLGIYAFAFQIFCDFAGYSSIARGLAKLMGIDIMVNFNLPYFAANPSEFWQRWHISLSSWLRDYLYIPLGGNRKGRVKTYRNLMLTMLLGGLWHGAAWTFVLWGAYHGGLLILHRLCAPVAGAASSLWSGWKALAWKTLSVVCFFHLICLGWLFFRAQSLPQVQAMLAGLFRFDPAGALYSMPDMAKMLLLVAPLLIIQIFQYRRDDFYVLFRANWLAQGAAYFFLIFVTMVFGAGGTQQFIYFQF